MIIPNKPVAGVLKAYGDQNKIVKNVKPSQPGSLQQKDEVVLSSRAQEFSHIYQAVKAMPEVRDDKVKGLSEQIASGKYQVDAKDIAAKMLEQLGRLVGGNS